jgi:predicted Fe-Mo cluster-binding NifX family protein
MKVAITSIGRDETSAVDGRFGRAPWLHVYDTATGESTVLDNVTNAEGRSGVGVRTAQAVVDAGVTVVMTGRVGPNAQRVLDGAGVKVVSNVEGSVRDAVATLVKNTNADTGGV